MIFTLPPRVPILISPRDAIIHLTKACTDKWKIIQFNEIARAPADYFGMEFLCQETKQSLLAHHREAKARRKIVYQPELYVQCWTVHLQPFFTFLL